MVILTPKQIRRVLCLGAHSDDIEIGCGGTILNLVKTNPATEFCWVVFSGDSVRRTEAQSGAKAFLRGARVKHVRVERFRESYFPSQWSAIKDRFESIRNRFEPDLVLTHCRDDRHQDHRVLSDLAWNTFRDHLILEYEIPKYDGDMGRPNVFVHLDAEASKKKVSYLMEAFQSQRSKRWFQEDTFFSLMRLRGMECNAPSGHAEAFYCRKVLLATAN
jgi:LmbE family N-acetylglucosaminyl deacetylase